MAVNLLSEKGSSSERFSLDFSPPLWVRQISRSSPWPPYFSSPISQCLAVEALEPWQLCPHWSACNLQRASLFIPCEVTSFPSNPQKSMPRHGGQEGIVSLRADIPCGSWGMFPPWHSAAGVRGHSYHASCGAASAPSFQSFWSFPWQNVRLYLSIISPKLALEISDQETFELYC